MPSGATALELPPASAVVPRHSLVYSEAMIERHVSHSLGWVVAGAAPSPSQARGALTLFIIVALLLGLFLLGVMLTIVNRRLRRQREGNQRQRPEPESPWEEAGRRAQPFDDGSADEG